MDLYKVPTYLVIHLKRFKNSTYQPEKNVLKVNFPVEGLNLTNYVLNKSKPKTNSMEIEDFYNEEEVILINQVIYDLYGIVNHYG